MERKEERYMKHVFKELDNLVKHETHDQLLIRWHECELTEKLKRLIIEELNTKDIVIQCEYQNFILGESLYVKIKNKWCRSCYNE